MLLAEEVVIKIPSLHTMIRKGGRRRRARRPAFAHRRSAAGWSLMPQPSPRSHQLAVPMIDSKRAGNCLLSTIN